jgi:hypothetical protein
MMTLELLLQKLLFVSLRVKPKIINKNKARNLQSKVNQI